MNQELLIVLANNVRTARKFFGDIHAQVAANCAGEKRIQELAGKYGRNMLLEYMDEMILYAERRMRSALAVLPRGRYAFEDYLEGDGLGKDPIKIKVAIEKGPDDLLIYEGCKPFCRSGCHPALS